MGNSLIELIAINTVSEAVSNFEPKLLVEFVFLALAPSIISLKPQSKYVIWNGSDGKEKNSKVILPMIREQVIILAKCFFIYSTTLNPICVLSFLYAVISPLWFSTIAFAIESPTP